MCRARSFLHTSTSVWIPVVLLAVRKVEVCVRKLTVLALNFVVQIVILWWEDMGRDRRPTTPSTTHKPCVFVKNPWASCVRRTVLVLGVQYLGVVQWCFAERCGNSHVADRVFHGGRLGVERSAGGAFGKGDAGMAVSVVGQIVCLDEEQVRKMTCACTVGFGEAVQREIARDVRDDWHVDGRLRWNILYDGRIHKSWS